MKKKTKYNLLLVLLILIIGGSIFVYLNIDTTPVVKFSPAKPFPMFENELAGFKKIETLMASDSTRYCEADFNGDGVLDRAYANDGQTIIIYSFGTNKERKVAHLQWGTSGFTCIACADVNQDGKIDLILGDPGDSVIDILYNNGKRDFTSVLLRCLKRVSLEPNGAYFIIKDINKDNFPDIIYKSDLGNYYVLVNQGKKS